MSDRLGSLAKLYENIADDLLENLVSMLKVDNLDVDIDPFTAAKLIGSLPDIISGDLEPVFELFSSLSSEDKDKFISSQVARNNQVRGIERKRQLDEMGCGLDDGARYAKVVSVIFKVGGAKLFSEIITEEAEQSETINSLLAEADTIAIDALTILDGDDDFLVEGSTAIESIANLRQTISNIRNSNFFPDRPTPYTYETIQTSIDSRKNQAKQAYIIQNGLDADNLTFADKLDIKSHLKSLGF